ncbi:MAG: MBL fold metallo-hydrolase [Candidatus Micrarchaeota archaeon]
MKLSFLGGSREIGKSCVLAQAGEVKLLLDSGMKIHDHNEPPQFKKYNYDAAIVTHAHLDHSGSLPVANRIRNIPWFASFPTVPLVELLLADAEKVAIARKNKPPFTRRELKRTMQKANALAYNQEYEFYDGTNFELFDAGHIVGSSQVLVRDDSTLLYSGDFKLKPSRMHGGAVVPREQVDYLVMESTYATREHMERKDVERDFAEGVQKAVDDGYTALIPAFAVGRSQEILQILHAHSIKADVYLDGMSKQVSEIFSDFPSYLRNYKAFQDALRKTKFVEDVRQRRAITRKPCVVVTTAGMLDGGPALSYLRDLNKTGSGKVFLTGFQVPKTNGNKLLKGEKLKFQGRNGNVYNTKVNLPVSFFDFSAHAGKSELYEYAEKVSPEKVFCVHGDELECEALAQGLKLRGFDAVAPRVGQVFKLK